MAKQILRDPNLSYLAARKHWETLERKQSDKFLARNTDGTVVHAALTDILER